MKIKHKHPFHPKTLRNLRRSANLTMAELAAASGVSESLISRMESGHRSVSSDKLSRIAAALEVHPGEFFEPLKTRKGK